MEIFGKEIYAAIFDMDGTMFDTERLRMETLKKASMELFGQGMSEELLVRSLGVSAVTAERYAKEAFGEDYPYAEIRKLADKYEVAHVRQHGVPVKRSLIDVLERFKKNEVLLAVATSSRRGIVEEYLASANVAKYFDVVVCGDEVENGKPHPEIFLKAAEKICCKPEECLIFEDSENGLKAAIASGANPVYIKDIKDPAPEIVAQAVFGCDKMSDVLEALIEVTRKYPVPRLNERFPQSYNKMTVGIHGFGAIGGGYITQIFSHWDGYSRPREIIGTTGDALLRNIVNAFDQFTVNYESIAYEQTIKNVRLIDMNDEDKVIDMYQRSEIVALCLPESAIRQQARVIARGLIARIGTRTRRLTILIVLNKVHAANYVKRQIMAALKEMGVVHQVKDILSMTYFCETVVNRMVSRISKPALLKQIQTKLRRISTEGSNEPEGQVSALTVPELRAIVGDHAAHGTVSTTSLKNITKTLSNISDIQSKFSRLNIVLYNSEPDMVLYTSSESPLLSRLRQVKAVDNIGVLQMIKNRLSNGTHAIIAWYSALLGYPSIGQGMGNERVQVLATQVMENEIKPMLVLESPDLTDYINDFIPAFIKRCRLSFKDPCNRVGRDPIRKLQKNERVLGTITMAHEHGDATPLLEFGIVLGLLYAIRQVNPEDRESQILKDLYEQKNRSVRDLITYRGEINGKVCEFLDPVEDADIVQNVVDYFTQYQNDPEGFFDIPLTLTRQPATA